MGHAASHTRLTRRTTVRLSNLKVPVLEYPGTWYFKTLHLEFLVPLGGRRTLRVPVAIGTLNL